MADGFDILFSPLELENATLPNRIVRSATYEGYGAPDGTPRPELAEVYARLAAGGTGTIITGFTFISQAGRAMQPRQCGINTAEKASAWRRITDEVRRAAPSVKLFMQIAHTGRQTLRRVTGRPVLGVSSRTCTYFRQRIQVPDDAAIREVIDEFAVAAERALQAGFDGVQIHAAHGYLIHQFLSGWTNTRQDRWGDRLLFLTETIRAVKSRVGGTFPILVKLSAADDNPDGVRLEDTIRTVSRLEELGIDAIEISYGTMEYGLNIIRGAHPVAEAMEVNPLFSGIPRPARQLWKYLFLKGLLRRLKPFTENYNVAAASAVKQTTALPVIVVGGIRSAASMVDCLTTHGLGAVGLCRPLIIDPVWPQKIRDKHDTTSRCTNCNLCTVHCDSTEVLRCRNSAACAHADKE